MLAAAARFSGADASVHFGPERQKQFPAAREGELARLAQESEAQPPPSKEPAFTGGEHAVFEDADRTAVVKHTLPGFYGRIMDESALLDPRTFLTRPKLTMRGALPSEYLRRWAVLHDIFGIPTTYQGRTGTKRAEHQMTVAQPYIEQDDTDSPEIGDVTRFMETYGFTKVNADLIAIPEVADVTWYRQSDGIIITDAHARNFRKDITGVIIPIDLVVTTLPKGITQILPEPLSEWAPTTL